uniref:Synaptobrevin, longin-like domain protein n=1 Tax=Tanacetum cinerariifolium TaxID=118510 RepID=A0A6L2K4X6_TANCI|nr:hypothetical protein [Tanacetum cinerariifolium]
MNPTIYVSYVKQFWATAKVKKVNDQEQIKALADKMKVILTEDSIRSDLRLDDAEGTLCLLNEAVFEGLARIGYEKPSQKLTFYKAYFSPQWKFMIHTILQCLSAKTTAWNEFSSTMASVIICLDDNQKFNFSKYIFDHMVKSLEGGKPQQPWRKQRKEAEVSHDESEDEDHVPTPSSDPLPSEIALDDETHRRTNDDKMFRVDDLAGEEVLMDSVAEPVTTVKDSAAPTTYVTEDEITMAQALVSLKSVKPKVVVQEQKMGTTILVVAIIVTTAVPTLRAKGIVFHEQKQSQIPTILSSKDKGKAKMIEPEVPLKKKDQMRIDEEYARKLQAEEQEAARLSRAQQDEEANNSWDNIQAMMDANRLLAERLQAREKEEFSEVQKARLLVELIEKRKKHFAALRAQEKRDKPPTKTQMKIQMSTYLIHMGRYKQSHLKGRSFDEIKELFDREMRKVNDFVAMDSEAQKNSAKEAQESSTKRTIEHLESDIPKKQKVDENVQPFIDDTEELKKCMEIVPGDGDEALIEATPISSRSPTIIDYKIHKEGKKNYFKIIRADVKNRFKKEKPVDDMDNILFRILKTMFEHYVEYTIWTYQQGLAKVKNWKLFESCKVYYITMQSIIYYLLVEKVYPLTRNTLHQLWSDVRLQVDYDVEWIMIF